MAAQAAEETSAKWSSRSSRKTASKEGVEETPSGLQYKVVEQGDGATPGPTRHRPLPTTTGPSSTARSSTARTSAASPLEFPVNRVIDGWTEALQMMKVGDKWESLPAREPDRLRGEGAPAPAIGPNATLVFTIELLDIVE